jgi:hypothetical protein
MRWESVGASAPYVIIALLSVSGCQGGDVATKKTEQATATKLETAEPDATAKRVDIASLEPFIGRDLRKLDSKSKAELEHAVSALRPKPDEPASLFGPLPWYLWRLPAQGKVRFVLFEGQPIFMIPGTSSAAVHLLDEKGAELGCSEFSTGWRIDLISASLHQEPPLELPVIDVRTDPVINGADICRQVYGILENRVTLLRIEDSGGRVLANNYYNPNHTIGPDAPVRSAEEWEQSLRSDSPVAVIEALRWLGGRHRTDLTPPPPDIGIEEQAPAKLFNAVRKRAGVRDAVAKLTASKNDWIREAAQECQRSISE